MTEAEELKYLRVKYKDEQAKVSILEKKLSVYENEELEKEGYYSLKYYVKQQIDVLKEFKLDEEITKSPKDDKHYDRVKAIGEGLKAMISDLKVLKGELGISTEEEKQQKRAQFRTSPESIADSIGNTAGKNI